jgi:peptide-methionine (R)-S-oxide reductase
MRFLFLVSFFSVACTLPSSGSGSAKQTEASAQLITTPVDTLDPRTLTDADWAQILPPDVYQVMRKHGTEQPYSCAFLNNKKPGTYSCAACSQLLFANTTKFESGTGWPSFNTPVNNRVLTEHTDVSYGMKRTEVRCSRCDGHLGHVFDDGPPPTGLRYCINGVALKFTPLTDGQ